MPLTTAPDVNVLVAASRSDHPHHRVAADWLDAALDDCARGARLLVFPMVAVGFVRLVTHSKVFSQPTPTGAALEFIEAVLGMPGVTLSALGDEWPAFSGLCRDADLAGNALTDAWIAAAAVVAGAHLVTFDRGFARLLDRHRWTLLSPAA